MKKPILARVLVTLLLALSMLSPTAVLAFADGKGHFKEGMRHEVAEEWDKAVEEFALAVSENPKNPEYRLHLTRALFQASQMYMKKGTMAAKESDYQGAYIAFRRAYAFDPTNELAKSEMERMVRLQKEINDASSGTKKDVNGNGAGKLVPTSYDPRNGQPQLPQKLEKLRDLPFPAGVDLQFIIKELARDLDLNVLFDVESFRTPRKTFIDLKNVTAARALDYIFLQEGLFFQKVGPRTILVATQAQRTKFQQLVLRTFYLANAAPKDVAKIVQTAIPAQPGRSQTIVLTDDATNSVTIRDTEENIRLIGKLIDSLDKDRAEVVMDVAIYEVNKTDLLELGNQIGNPSSLTLLGGVTRGVVGLGGNTRYGTIGRAVADIIPSAFGAGIVLPETNLVAFQSRGDTKLIASTQIHAFNNEDSSARIGQRVPVQSAQYVTGATIGGNGVVSNVVNYEQVGLTLKFKPLVFPNQDVQVAMEIESKDVAPGGTRENPVFTERTIKGTARIQNNKTLLLASVASGVQNNSRYGLPFIGLIPILGRLFSVPHTDSRNLDIVIAVTPRVIRAPAILPEDEVERPTGSLAVPTNNSLEALIVQEEQEELLAAARRIPNQTTVAMPGNPMDSPQYIKAESSSANTASRTVAPPTALPPAAAENRTAAVEVPTKDQPAAASTAPTLKNDLLLKPIDNSVKTLQLNQTSDTSAAPVEESPAQSQPAGPAPANPDMLVSIGSDYPEMKAGDKIKIPVIIKGSAAIRSGVIGIKFDDKRFAVRSVSYGDVFGADLLNTAATPFLNQNGKMYVSLTASDDIGAKNDGTLAVIEIESLAGGRPELVLDTDVLNFLTPQGKYFQIKLGK
jgi:general secretion pathway protein D